METSTNTYLIKYRVPNEFGPTELFVNWVQITDINDNNPPEGFYKSLSKACVENVLKVKGIIIKPHHIDFIFVSLIHSVRVKKEE